MVLLPRGKVHERTLTNPQSIQSLLNKQLTKGSPLLVGVCAEVLTDEIDKGGPCGGHAITLKKQNAHSYLVVDSAFFSDRPKNPDGSIWIQKSVVHLAISKNGVVIKKSIKNYQASMDKIKSEIGSLNANISVDNAMAEMDTFFSNFIKSVKVRTQGYTGQELKTRVIEIMTKIDEEIAPKDGEEEYNPSDDEIKNNQIFKKQALAEVAKLDLQTVADVDNMKPLLMKLIASFFNRLLETLKPKGSTMDNLISNINFGGNITWIE